MPDWLKEFLPALVIGGAALLALFFLAKRAMEALGRLVRALGVRARALLRDFASGGVGVLFPGGESRYTRLVEDLSGPGAKERGRKSKLLSALATGGVSLLYEPAEGSVDADAQPLPGPHVGT